MALFLILTILPYKSESYFRDINQLRIDYYGNFRFLKDRRYLSTGLFLRGVVLWFNFPHVLDMDLEMYQCQKWKEKQRNPGEFNVSLCIFIPFSPFRQFSQLLVLNKLLSPQWHSVVVEQTTGEVQGTEPQRRLIWCVRNLGIFLDWIKIQLSFQGEHS